MFAATFQDNNTNSEALHRPLKVRLIHITLKMPQFNSFNEFFLYMKFNSNEKSMLVKIYYIHYINNA